MNLTLKSIIITGTIYGCSRPTKACIYGINISINPSLSDTSAANDSLLRQETPSTDSYSIIVKTRKAYLMVLSVS